MTVLLSRAVDWYCPNCGLRETTSVPATEPGGGFARFHTCPKLRMLPVSPMVPVGTRAKVEVQERDDYVNGEVVRLDPERGRPIKSIVTTRDNGQDVIVFAPTATAKGS